jgi:hypothetical protein
MTEEQARLFSEFDSASRDIHKSLITTKGGTQAEARYAKAYQNLVRLGLKGQIKKKYRWL